MSDKKNTQVVLRDDGVLALFDPESPYMPRIVLDQDEVKALRTYFQEERDTELNRWRDPQNPGIVCYPVTGNLDAVWVMREGDGSRYLATRTRWERIGPHYVAEAACRYFQAHPEPKPRPWEEAKPGEIWEIGLLELGPSACLVTEGDFVEISKRFEVAIGSSLIESGRRIWPEPRIGGAE